MLVLSEPIVPLRGHIRLEVYEGECTRVKAGKPRPSTRVLECSRPGRDYHGDGQGIICHEHYLYDRAVMRRSQTIQQVREGTLHTEITYDTHTKCYQLVAANGAEPGNYPKRRETEEAQLALEVPEILELARRVAERYPMLAGRALRVPMAPTIDAIGLNSSPPARCTWTLPATGWRARPVLSERVSAGGVHPR